MRQVAVAALLLSLTAGACGGSSGGGVTVSPASANVLTCSTQAFAAAVTDETDMTVTWSIGPATSGSIDATGTYTAPLTTPAPAAVDVIATSVADTKKKGSALVTLATAFPGTATTVTGSTGGTGGVFPHAIAARGTRVYSVWGTPTSNAPRLMLSRSDDGGATWLAAVPAISLTLANGLTNSFAAPANCAAVAIDAGNPDVVYVYGRMGDENDLGDAHIEDHRGGETSFLSVSTDGGTTFTTTVMQVGGTAGGPSGGWDSAGVCGDVASPAPDTVVVESPGGYNGDGNPDIAIWSDSARGAGFATGVALSEDYLADGATHALDNLQGNHDITPAHNSTTDNSGGAVESPRLFTDGAGRLCITYYGITQPPAGEQAHTYVQCSNAAAKIFSTPLIVDPAWPVSQPISSPVGAFGPNGQAALLWTTGTTMRKLFVATSTDGGATFSAPRSVPLYQRAGGPVAALNPEIDYDAAGILWISYVGWDDTHDRVIVDKSCDGGQSWSGPVIANGHEGAIADMHFPGFAITTGPAPHLVATASDRLAYFTLAP